MILKTLLEEKQLDFNQPLLSVRRFTSTLALELENKIDNSSRPKLSPIPVYKAELKSGPIRSPGTVPFVWEQTPGRPKNERKPQAKVPERQSGAPKLPPGRMVNIKHDYSVKFQKTASATQSLKENVLSDSKQYKPVNEWSLEDEGMKLVEEELSSGSNDGDEASIDALDTLSRTESFFMRCSASGVSELEELGIKPSGTFSTDSQTRDFMMGRFLPAAKAIAAETLQHAPRKAPVVQEQHIQLRKFVIKEKQDIRTTALPHDVQAIGAEDTADDDVETGNYAPKVCGLFPIFCLLNSIPGTGMQERISSFRGLQAKINVASHRESRKGRARNVSCEEMSVTGSPQIAYDKNERKVENGCKQPNCKIDSDEWDGSSRCKLQDHGVSVSQNVNPHWEEEAFRGPPDKSKSSNVKNTNPHETRSHTFHELLAKEGTALESDSGSLAVVEKTLYIDAVHRFKSGSSANAIQMEGRILEEGSGFEPSLKNTKSEEDPASLESSLEDNDKNLSQMDEKATLHLTSSESLDSCFLSCADRAHFKVIDDSRCDRNLLKDSTTLRSSERVKIGSENHGPIRPDDHGRCHASVHSPSILNSNLAYSQVIDPKSQRAKKTDSSETSTHDSVSKQSSKYVNMKRNLERKPETRLGEKESSCHSAENCTVWALSTVPCDGKIQLESKLDDGELTNGQHLQLPLALPLPKAPSESWLKRTIPAVSSRNISSRSPLAVQVSTRFQTKGACDPNWKTMVRSSNTHYSHVGFSEEKLAPIRET